MLDLTWKLTPSVFLHLIKDTSVLHVEEEKKNVPQHNLWLNTQYMPVLWMF